MIIMPFRILKNVLFILMQGESGVVSDERGCDSNENTRCLLRTQRDDNSILTA